MRARIFLIRLFQFFPVGLLVPVLTLVFLDRGLSLSQTALVFAFFSGSCILLEIPTGIVADLIGRKKTFLFSCALTMLAFVLILLSRSLYVLFLGAVLFGAGRAFSSGSLDALFIEQHTKAFGQSRLPRIISLFSVSEAVGLGAGALAGGYLPVVTSSRLPGLGKYDLNLIANLVCMLILLILVSLFVHEATSPQGIGIKAHISSSRKLLSENRNLQWLFACVLTAGLLIGTAELGWQPRFTQILADDRLLWLLGILSALYFLAILLGNASGEKLVGRFHISYKALYFAAKVFSGSAFIVLALQTQAMPFMALYMLTYFFIGVGNIPEGTLINREIPDEKRASILSLNSLVAQSGGLLGTLTGGLIVQIAGIPTLWIIAGAVMIFSSSAVLKVRPKPDG